MNKKLIPFLVLASSALVLTACPGQQPTPTPEPEPTPTPEPPTPEPEPTYDPANGYFNFVNSSIEERTKILGTLEKYAVESKLTGITLFNNGGYVMYNPGVVKGATSYIPGFGFAILSEGRIEEDLAGETNEAWKRYYHEYEVNDPANINVNDSDQETVSSLMGFITESYFTTVLNETRDGYSWTNALADSERPIAVDLDESTGLAHTWKFPVKVGAALKYNTNSTIFSAYNGREVALEDYVTPYKMLFTQFYGLKRSGETLTGTGSIAGRKAYYTATDKPMTDEALEEAWEKVGVKAFVDETDGKSYLQFTLNEAYNQFFAMYYLSSGTMAPVPAEFISDIGGGDFAAGVKLYGKYNEDKSRTPLDHTVSVGPYTLERWDAGQQIVFKKNPYFYDANRYNIAGVHVNILEAAGKDREAAFNEFLANKLHAASIPATKLDEYVDDPRTTKTIGDTNWKLNMNTCDQETWESLFGVDGSIAQTPRDQYWELEPAMNNKNFTSGISFALDRQSFAKSQGRTPAFDYFSPAFLSDPENGISYNTTDEHKAAVADLLEGTDGYGYSLELAKAAFKKASEELIAEGSYTEGQTIELEIAWGTSSTTSAYHATVKNFLETAFNTTDNPLKLNVVSWDSSDGYDVYYKKMMIGQFDIGMGSISGDTYNPLSFLNVLSTDKVIAEGFCLNWGIDTNKNDGGIVYNDMTWSFDGLFKSAHSGAFVKGGENKNLFESYRATGLEALEDGSIVLTGTYKTNQITEGEEVIADADIGAICIYGYDDERAYSDYVEYYVYNTELGFPKNDGEDFGITDDPSNLVLDKENGTFVATFSPVISDYFRHYQKNRGFDIYAYTYQFGEDSVDYLASIRVNALPAAPLSEE